MPVANWTIRPNPRPKPEWGTEPKRRRSLLSKADHLRQLLQQHGWDTGLSVSQIIPLKIGSLAATMQLSQRLRDPIDTLLPVAAD